LNILFATTAYPRWQNDTHGVFVHQQAIGLRALGHNVRVVAMHAPGCRAQDVIDGIEVIRPRYLPDRLEVSRNQAAGIPEMWKRSKVARLTLVPFIGVHILTIARQARAHRADIVHAHWTLSAMAARLGGAHRVAPLITTVHGSDMFQAAAIPGIRQLTRQALRSSRAVVAISEALGDAVRTNGAHADRLHIVPECIDAGAFTPGPPTRERLVLYAGSLIERKGVAFLIQAMAALRASGQPWRCEIVGEGTLRAALEAQRDTLGLSDCITFLGPVSQQQLRERMQAASVFVLPSTEEGLGVVLMEAMACATPCVGSNVGGIPDIITPATGALFAPGDSAALASAIQHISEQHTWPALSVAARARAVAVYDRSVIANRLSSIYADARSPATPHTRP
jgi:glycosyltransferase involved in cell wall biosynthesis